MLFDDNLDPQKQSKKPRSLDKMSIEELENYIAELKDEILRVEDDIKKKKAHREAAASIFK